MLRDRTLPGPLPDPPPETVDLVAATFARSAIGETVPPADSRSATVSAPDLLVCPELAYLIAAARDAAWRTHCNVLGLTYYERKESLARLRGALSAYDRARGVV